MPVGFLPFFSHISLRFTATVAVSLDLCVWMAPITVFACSPTSGYYSSSWKASIGQNSSCLCATVVVRDVVAPKSVSRPHLDAGRYGKIALTCSSPTNKAKVWDLNSLSHWVYLTPLILTVLRWWCGCLVHCWSRLIVVSLPPSVTHLGSHHCGDVESCVCPLLLCHTGFAIYTPLQSLELVIGFWWTLLAVDFLSMSSPPSSPSEHLGHPVILPPFPYDGRAGGRNATQSPHNPSHTEGSCSKAPSPLTAATFSEALILGVGCQDQPTAKGSELLGRESASSPTPPASMSSLCLLAKPWGDPIPLAIVISKTRKD